MQSPANALPWGGIMSDCSDPDAQIRKLQNYLDSMQVGTWEWNVQTGELVINERWAEIAGFSLADLTPVNIDVWTWLVHPEDLVRSNQALLDHFEGKFEYYEIDVRIRHKNGNWIWVRDRGKVMDWTPEGQPLWMYGTHEDVSYRIDATRGVRESKLHEDQLLYAANHDALTGLLNRTALKRMSKQSIQGLPVQTTLSALLIDVDNFRGVNDTLGHQGGDQVLSELAQVIQTCSGSYNQVFRYSGDEFLVLTRLSDEDQVAKLARSIQAAVARQFKYKHQLVQITVSIGICLDKPGYSLDQVIINADMALFVAKSTRNTVAFYRQSMSAARTRAEILSADLSTALDKGEFELYFQPIFDIQRNRFRHAEALLRWNHPKFGLLAPGEFIPLAERNRLIIPMTDWVIRETCKKLAEWKKVGFPDLAISVN
ncbi:MAG: diguanylate cyclase, partial [Clostridia bacterium]|nr:diguanylate cyclase [Clostridia bacterium]